MKFIGTLCLLLLTLPLFAQDGRPTSDADAKQLIALEKMWNQVQMLRDWQALDSIIGDRFLGTYSNGHLGRKADFIENTKKNHVKPARVTIDHLQVELYGDTAIVTGVYHAQGTDNGKPYDELGRFTDTWVRARNKWQCVAAHASPSQNGQ